MMVIFQLAINKTWCSARISIGTTVFSHLNDLPEVLNSEVKLFADHISLFSIDTSLFSIVNCVNTSTLNSDLLKIQDWAYLWKMSFNPDRNKKAREVIFSGKKNATTHPPHNHTSTHPPLFFSNSQINPSSDQKNVGFTLDSKLSPNEHINYKIY